MVVSENRVSVQDEIRKLYLEEGLTQSEIAVRRGTSRPAVCKVIKKLREKGLLDNELTIGVNKDGVTQPAGCFYRLHNVQIVIRVLRGSQFYQGLLKRCNNFSLCGCTVLLYNDKVDLYLGEDVDFRGKDIQGVYYQAVVFFKKVFYKLENRLHVILVKDQYLNKVWVRQHLEKVNGGVGQYASKQESKLRFLKDDGKTWLLADKSLNGRNHEYIHPSDARADAEALEPYLSDLAFNQPLTNSQLTARLNDVITALEKLLKVIK